MLEVPIGTVTSRLARAREALAAILSEGENAMTISDELLMAYVDGELDTQARSEVERAIESDPEVARRVSRQRALRDRLRAAFDGVLSEPVPDRLVTAARGAPATSAREGNQEAGVTDLAQTRADRAAAQRARRRWSWPEWSAIAASVVLGAVIGHLRLEPTRHRAFHER